MESSSRSHPNGSGSLPEDTKPPLEEDDPSVPRTEPIKGVVQPPVHPPASKPGRLTNQTYFLKNVLVKGMWRHNNSWPFQSPVDTVALDLPDYFKIVTSPMDLGTIKRRLDNTYYYTGAD
eukprot:TRINITY_DN1220_c0_g1_i1.p1 TRINITY_DN1220_c0_g1~~TRINITY_DN1220_c0_g1_i1.p1  ORF type:complete len:120 (-),score=40.40 TRINITY_DN1220_c0_g1_i1:314-673(-)